MAKGTPARQFYTLSLHDALPISCLFLLGAVRAEAQSESAKPKTTLDAAEQKYVGLWEGSFAAHGSTGGYRSEEHTSELQSRGHLVCRLLLEKKKNTAFTLSQRQI